MNYSPRMFLAIATAVNVLSYFVLSKTVALHDGISGIAILGIVSGISNIFALFADLNVGGELTRRLALGRSRSEDKAVITKAVLRITIAGSLLLLGLLSVVSPYLTQELSLSRESVIAAGVAGAGTILAQQCFNFLSGLGAAFRVAGGTVARSIAVTGTMIFAMTILRISLPFAYLLGILAGTLAAWSFTVGKLAIPRDRVPWALYREVLSAGGSITISVVAYYGALFLVPILIQAVAGTETNGLTRAAMLVSGALLQFLNTTCRYEFFPRLNAATSTQQAEQVIRDELRLLVSAMGCMTALLVGLQHFLWPVFLTGDFAEASGVLVWILIGDLLRSFVIVIGFSLYGRIGAKQLVVLEVSNGSTLLLFIFFAARESGTPQSVGVAYAGAHLFAVLVAAVMAHRTLVAEKLWGELGLLMVSVVVTFGTNAASALPGVFSSAVPAVGFLAVATMFLKVAPINLRRRSAVISD